MAVCHAQNNGRGPPVDFPLMRLLISETKISCPDPIQIMATSSLQSMFDPDTWMTHGYAIKHVASDYRSIVWKD